MSSTKKERVPVAAAYLFSGAAPAVAAIATNPLDVARVRMQVNAELGMTRAFRSSLHCVRETIRHEGLRAAQRGLSVAMFREVFQNVPRLGMYMPIITTLHDGEASSAPLPKRMLAGTICGAAGALASNPFEIVKARVQLSTTRQGVFQTNHGYRGLLDGFSSIIRKEGVAALWKGGFTCVCRCVVGTTSQMVAYTYTMDFMEANGWDNVGGSLIAGTVSGIFLSLCMNPVDLVRSRLYNQPFHADGTGKLYRGMIDCFRQTVAKEGFSGLWKGIVPQMTRQGPHIALSMVILSAMKRGYHNHLDE